MKKIISLTALLYAGVNTTLVAAETQEAHVHGLATLAMAIENTQLDVQFESPSANIVGFEHEARTDEQIQAVENAQRALASAASLFTFKGTDCELEKKSVDVSALLGAEKHHDHKDEHHHDEHDHHKDHRDEHDHHDHKEHKHHGDHEHHGGHSEITANYHFECKSTKDLSGISVMLFEKFPAIEKINALWVTETQQDSEVLTPRKSTISLK